MEVKKLFSVICLTLLVMFSLIACGENGFSGLGNSNNNTDTTPVAEELTLEADKTTVSAGQKVTFSALLKKGEEVSTPTNVTYAITEGADHAAIAGNILTVN